MSEAIDQTPETASDFKEKLNLRILYGKGLASFRQKVKAPKKNGHVNYHTKAGQTAYDYVLLPDLIQAIDDGIKDTGLAWIQDSKTEQNSVSVRTIIFHDGGYIYESSWITIKTSGQAQDIGSAMTYAKRYSLGTAFGISSEPDDDGQQANNYRPSQNGNGNQAGSSNANQTYRGSANKKASDKQVKMIYAQFGIAAKRDGKDSDQLAHQFLVKKGISDFKELTSQDASNLIGKMKDKNDAEEKAQASQPNGNQQPQNNPGADPFAGTN
ncbi:ERF family protein [Lactiplantibacillus pentosus]|uniref:ERF family protein n=1 Tax=Lactiplantibacillus pentosus TaxID=1589 RepID=UPI001330E803|nr:ERF family protein [Lactiplantibacillus pentosus]MBQ0836073.1 ERF family protein [Lactiplantibacillus pentosus]